MSGMRTLLCVAGAVSLAVGLWWFSGGRSLFTHQTRVVTLERAADPDDFMEIAQADEHGMLRETRHIQGWWLGLAPGDYPRPGAWAPSLLWLSVITVLTPLWVAVAAVALRTRRKKARSKSGPE